MASCASRSVLVGGARRARGYGHHRVLGLIEALLHIGLIEALLHAAPSRLSRTSSWHIARGAGAAHLHWRQQLLLLAPVVSG